MRWAAWTARAEEAETEIRALYLALRDPRTPTSAKAVLTVLVGYVLSPIDPIPDIIPILGFLDEVIVLPVGMVLIRRMVPAEILDECRATAESGPPETPLKWVGLALSVLLWIAGGIVIWWLLT